MNVACTLTFAKGYIAHPFWPELERVINIQKESGVNRARSLVRREQALKNYLVSVDLTQEQYEQLLAKSRRQFYTAEDIFDTGNGHKPTEIVIPAHQLYGCIAQAADLASSGVRISTASQIRTVLTVQDFWTGKYGADGTWERFAVVKTGTGQTLSNQRSLRINDFITSFSAHGSIRFSDDILDPIKVRRFMEYAGREIGVGASRKLGWGRFEITEWKES